MLKDAQIILLDEATASLDPENEVEIQKAIGTLIKGRTVIAIAHRLKTIKKADRIIVLDNGQIKEEGTHDELIRQEGLYSHLWNIQESISGDVYKRQQIFRNVSMDLKTAVPVWWNWTRRFSYLRDIVWCNPSKITGRARQPILKAISGKKTIKSIYTKNWP